jgi:hypothetical protein
MRISAKCGRNYTALAGALALGAVCVAAQSRESLDDVLARVGERIGQYFARAQSIVFTESMTIQPLQSNLSPGGFARVIESEIRLEPQPADGDGNGSSEIKVVRQVRKINGHAPRAADARNSCLDPNPVSPEPLAFLLPSERSGYAFTWVGRGKGKDQDKIIIDFRELGSGPPEVKEREPQKGADCEGFQIELPGRTTGRVWIDASTYEVSRVDQSIGTMIDLQLPKSKRRPSFVDDHAVLERTTTSTRYKTTLFHDPEEVVLLPESIETLMVVRGLQSYRMKQVFSEYRRFVTAGRLVK